MNQSTLATLPGTPWHRLHTPASFVISNCLAIRGKSGRWQVYTQGKCAPARSAG